MGIEEYLCGTDDHQYQALIVPDRDTRKVIVEDSSIDSPPLLLRTPLVSHKRARINASRIRCPLSAVQIVLDTGALYSPRGSGDTVPFPENFEKNADAITTMLTTPTLLGGVPWHTLLAAAITAATRAGRADRLILAAAAAFTQKSDCDKDDDTCDLVLAISDLGVVSLMSIHDEHPPPPAPSTRLHMKSTSSSSSVPTQTHFLQYQDATPFTPSPPAQCKKTAFLPVTGFHTYQLEIISASRELPSKLAVGIEMPADQEFLDNPLSLWLMGDGKIVLGSGLGEETIKPVTLEGVGEKKFTFRFNCFLSEGTVWISSPTAPLLDYSGLEKRGDKARFAIYYEASSDLEVRCGFCSPLSILEWSLFTEKAPFDLLEKHRVNGEDICNVLLDRWGRTVVHAMESEAWSSWPLDPSHEVFDALCTLYRQAPGTAAQTFFPTQVLLEQIPRKLKVSKLLCSSLSKFRSICQELNFEDLIHSINAVYLGLLLEHSSSSQLTQDVISISNAAMITLKNYVSQKTPPSEETASPPKETASPSEETASPPKETASSPVHRETRRQEPVRRVLEVLRMFDNYALTAVLFEHVDPHEVILLTFDLAQDPDLAEAAYKCLQVSLSVYLTDESLNIMDLIVILDRLHNLFSQDSVLAFNLAECILPVLEAGITYVSRNVKSRLLTPYVARLFVDMEQLTLNPPLKRCITAFQSARAFTSLGFTFSVNIDTPPSGEDLYYVSEQRLQLNRPMCAEFTFSSVKCRGHDVEIYALCDRAPSSAVPPHLRDLNTIAHDHESNVKIRIWPVSKKISRIVAMRLLVELQQTSTEEKALPEISFTVQISCPRYTNIHDTVGHIRSLMLSAFTVVNRLQDVTTDPFTALENPEKLTQQDLKSIAVKAIPRSDRAAVLYALLYQRVCGEIPSDIQSIVERVQRDSLDVEFVSNMLHLELLGISKFISESRHVRNAAAEQIWENWASLMDKWTMFNSLSSSLAMISVCNSLIAYQTQFSNMNPFNPSLTDTLIKVSLPEGQAELLVHHLRDLSSTEVGYVSSALLQLAVVVANHLKLSNEIYLPLDTATWKPRLVSLRCSVLLPVILGLILNNSQKFSAQTALNFWETSAAVHKEVYNEFLSCLENFDTIFQCWDWAGSLGRALERRRKLMKPDEFSVEEKSETYYVPQTELITAIAVVIKPPLPPQSQPSTGPSTSRRAKMVAANVQAPPEEEEEVPIGEEVFVATGEYVYCDKLKRRPFLRQYFRRIYDDDICQVWIRRISHQQRTRVSCLSFPVKVVDARRRRTVFDMDREIFSSKFESFSVDLEALERSRNFSGGRRGYLVTQNRIPPSTLDGLPQALAYVTVSVRDKKWLQIKGHSGQVCVPSPLNMIRFREGLVSMASNRHCSKGLLIESGKAQHEWCENLVRISQSYYSTLVFIWDILFSSAALTLAQQHPLTSRDVIESTGARSLDLITKLVQPAKPPPPLHTALGHCMCWGDRTNSPLTKKRSSPLPHHRTKASDEIDLDCLRPPKPHTSSSIAKIVSPCPVLSSLVDIEPESGGFRIDRSAVEDLRYSQHPVQDNRVANALMAGIAIHTVHTVPVRPSFLALEVWLADVVTMCRRLVRTLESNTSRLDHGLGVLNRLQTSLMTATQQAINRGSLSASKLIQLQCEVSIALTVLSRKSHTPRVPLLPCPADLTMQSYFRVDQNEPKLRRPSPQIDVETAIWSTPHVSAASGVLVTSLIPVNLCGPSWWRIFVDRPCSIGVDVVSGARLAGMAIGKQRLPEAMDLRVFHVPAVHTPMMSCPKQHWRLHGSQLVIDADRGPNRLPHSLTWLDRASVDRTGHGPCQHGYSPASLTVQIFPNLLSRRLDVRVGSRRWFVPLRLWPVINHSTSQSPKKESTSGRLRQRLKRFLNHVKAPEKVRKSPLTSRRAALPSTFQMYLSVVTYKSAHEGIQIALRDPKADKDVPDINQWSFTSTFPKLPSPSVGPGDCRLQGFNDDDIENTFKRVPLIWTPVLKPVPLSTAEQPLVRSLVETSDFRVPSRVFQSPDLTGQLRLEGSAQDTDTPPLATADDMDTLKTSISDLSRAIVARDTVTHQLFQTSIVATRMETVQRLTSQPSQGVILFMDWVEQVRRTAEQFASELTELLFPPDSAERTDMASIAAHENRMRWACSQLLALLKFMDKTTLESTHVFTNAPEQAPEKEPATLDPFSDPHLGAIVSGVPKSWSFWRDNTFGDAINSARDLATNGSFPSWVVSVLDPLVLRDVLGALWHVFLLLLKTTFADPKLHHSADPNDDHPEARYLRLKLLNQTLHLAIQLETSAKDHKRTVRGMTLQNPKFATTIVEMAHGYLAPLVNRAELIQSAVQATEQAKFDCLHDFPQWMAADIATQADLHTFQGRVFFLSQFLGGPAVDNMLKLPDVPLAWPTVPDVHGPINSECNPIVPGDVIDWVKEPRRWERFDAKYGKCTLSEAASMMVNRGGGGNRPSVDLSKLATDYMNHASKTKLAFNVTGDMGEIMDEVSEIPTHGVKASHPLSAGCVDAQLCRVWAGLWEDVEPASDGIKEEENEANWKSFSDSDEEGGSVSSSSESHHNTYLTHRPSVPPAEDDAQSSHASDSALYEAAVGDDELSATISSDPEEETQINLTRQSSLPQRSVRFQMSDSDFSGSDRDSFPSVRRHPRPRGASWCRSVARRDSLIVTRRRASQLFRPQRSSRARSEVDVPIEDVSTSRTPHNAVRLGVHPWHPGCVYGSLIRKLGQAGRSVGSDIQVGGTSWGALGAAGPNKLSRHMSVMTDMVPVARVYDEDLLAVVLDEHYSSSSDDCPNTPPPSKLVVKCPSGHPLVRKAPGPQQRLWICDAFQGRCLAGRLRFREWREARYSCSHCDVDYCSTCYPVILADVWAEWLRSKSVTFRGPRARDREVLYGGIWWHVPSSALIRPDTPTSPRAPSPTTMPRRSASIDLGRTDKGSQLTVQRNSLLAQEAQANQEMTSYLWSWLRQKTRAPATVQPVLHYRRVVLQQWQLGLLSQQLCLTNFKILNPQMQISATLWANLEIWVAGRPSLRRIVADLLVERALKDETARTFAIQGFSKTLARIEVLRRMAIFMHQRFDNFDAEIAAMMKADPDVVRTWRMSYAGADVLEVSSGGCVRESLDAPSIVQAISERTSRGENLSSPYDVNLESLYREEGDELTTPQEGSDEVPLIPLCDVETTLRHRYLQKPETYNQYIWATGELVTLESPRGIPGKRHCATVGSLHRLAPLSLLAGQFSTPGTVWSFQDRHSGPALCIWRKDMTAVDAYTQETSCLYLPPTVKPRILADFKSRQRRPPGSRVWLCAATPRQVIASHLFGRARLHRTTSMVGFNSLLCEADSRKQRVISQFPLLPNDRETPSHEAPLCSANLIPFWLEDVLTHPGSNFTIEALHLEQRVGTLFNLVQQYEAMDPECWLQILARTQHILCLGYYMNERPKQTLSTFGWDVFQAVFNLAKDVMVITQKNQEYEGPFCNTPLLGMTYQTFINAVEMMILNTHRPTMMKQMNQFWSLLQWFDERRFKQLKIPSVKRVKQSLATFVMNHVCAYLHYTQHLTDTQPINEFQPPQIHVSQFVSLLTYDFPSIPRCSPRPQFSWERDQLRSEMVTFRGGFRVHTEQAPLIWKLQISPNVASAGGIQIYINERLEFNLMSVPKVQLPTDDAFFTVYQPPAAPTRILATRHTIKLQDILNAQFLLTLAAAPFHEWRAHVTAEDWLDSTSFPSLPSLDFSQPLLQYTFNVTETGFESVSSTELPSSNYQAPVNGYDLLHSSWLSEELVCPDDLTIPSPLIPVSDLEPGERMLIVTIFPAKGLVEIHLLSTTAEQCTGEVRWLNSNVTSRQQGLWWPLKLTLESSHRHSPKRASPWWRFSPTQDSEEINRVSLKDTEHFRSVSARYFLIPEKSTARAVHRDNDWSMSLGMWIRREGQVPLNLESSGVYEAFVRMIDDGKEPTNISVTPLTPVPSTQPSSQSNNWVVVEEDDTHVTRTLLRSNSSSSYSSTASTHSSYSSSSEQHRLTDAAKIFDKFAQAIDASTLSTEYAAWLTVYKDLTELMHLDEVYLLAQPYNMLLHNHALLQDQWTGLRHWVNVSPEEARPSILAAEMKPIRTCVAQAYKSGILYDTAGLPATPSHPAELIERTIMNLERYKEDSATDKVMSELFRYRRDLRNFTTIVSKGIFPEAIRSHQISPPNALALYVRRQWPLTLSAYGHNLAYSYTFMGAPYVTLRPTLYQDLLKRQTPFRQCQQAEFLARDVLANLWNYANDYQFLAHPFCVDSPGGFHTQSTGRTELAVNRGLAISENRTVSPVLSQLTVPLTKVWNPVDLIGRKRPMQITLSGEGAHDLGGPYLEAVSDAAATFKSIFLTDNANAVAEIGFHREVLIIKDSISKMFNSVLPPNLEGQIPNVGEDLTKVVTACQETIALVRHRHRKAVKTITENCSIPELSSPAPEPAQWLHGFGMLLGCAAVCGCPIDVTLSPTLWRLANGDVPRWKDLAPLDSYILQAEQRWQLYKELCDTESPELDAVRQEWALTPLSFSAIAHDWILTNEERSMLTSQADWILEILEKVAATESATTEEVAMKTAADKAAVAMIDLYLTCRKSSAMLAGIVPWKLIASGIHRILPADVIKHHLHPRDLELAACGCPFIDIDMLKAHTTICWGEHRSLEEPLVEWLWAELEDMDQKHRRLFVRFVSGRSRLPHHWLRPEDSRPQSESRLDFEIKFIRDAELEDELNLEEEPGPDTIDARLPTATTCFLTLRLPFYSDRKILRERLLTAITVCTDIDLDD